MGDPRVVFGVRPVEELVRARPKDVQVVYVADGYRSAEIDKAVQAAKERGVSGEVRSRRVVAGLEGGDVHKGEGAGAEQGERLDPADLKGPTGLVVGAEGKGMREAVARRCDGLFHIPQRGAVSSLNASVAAAIALYEAARQRGGI